MPVRVVPTLAAMAEVYGLSREGGPRSPRFTRYIELGRAGVPVSGYNPMTSKDALGTVTALLAVDAESLVVEAASECLARLGLSSDVDIDLWVTVATPGMWTDRLATEIEHRLTDRSPVQVLFWTGEDVTVPAVRHEAIAQTVRAALTARHGVAETAARAMDREGLACALADVLTPAARADAEDPAVAEALTVVGSDTALATKAALLYGDEAASTMGWTPLGLPPHAGYRHATARAHATLSTSGSDEFRAPAGSERGPNPTPGIGQEETRP